jgi:hypothetical protein
MTLFKLSELQQKEEVPVDDRDKRLALKFQQMHFNKVESVKNLLGALPEENEIFFLETTKSFNAFTFIVYLIKHVGAINDLFVATYGLNSRIVNSLDNWMTKDQIDKVHIYISDSLHHRTPKVADLIDGLAAAQPDRFRVTYSWTHKKVMCARIGNDHFVIEGSGNWSENSSEEQYIFTKSKQLYEFRRGKH